MGSDVADLKGQFDFLHLQPFNNKNFFTLYVRAVYELGMRFQVLDAVLLCTLSQCMIRHTKLQVTIIVILSMFCNKRILNQPIKYNSMRCLGSAR